MATFSKEQLAMFDDVFRMFDKSGKGALSTRDLGTVVRAMGGNPTEDELSRMMSELDTNGTGAVEYDEFLQLMQHYLQAARQAAEAQEAALKEAFKLFDRDGNGRITAAELRFLMTSTGEPLSTAQAEALLADADIDKDGTIDYEEFVRMTFGDRKSLFPPVYTDDATAE